MKFVILFVIDIAIIIVLNILLDLLMKKNKVYDQLLDVDLYQSKNNRLILYGTLIIFMIIMELNQLFSNFKFLIIYISINFILIGLIPKLAKLIVVLDPKSKSIAK